MHGRSAGEAAAVAEDATDPELASWVEQLQQEVCWQCWTQIKSNQINVTPVAMRLKNLMPFIDITQAANVALTAEDAVESELGQLGGSAAAGGALSVSINTGSPHICVLHCISGSGCRRLQLQGTRKGVNSKWRGNLQRGPMCAC
jgi:hypothetical protein